MSFFNRRNRQSQSGGPGSQYDRDPEQTGVIHRPADESAPEEPETPAPQPEPQSEPTQGSTPPAAQQPQEKPLSYTGIDFEGYGTIVLYELREGEQPKRIEEIIDIWKSLPEGSQFDVMSLPAEVYCFEKDGKKMRTDIVPDEALCSTIIASQAEKIKKHLAELTGEKPADPAAAELTATIKALTKEQLFAAFSALDAKELQKLLDTAHAANKQLRKQSESQQSGQQSGSGEQPKTGGTKPQPQTPPAPAPRFQPTARGRSGASMASW